MCSPVNPTDISNTVLTEPTVSVQELPTKDDENDLVATPDMVVRPSRSGMLGLVVGGRAMLGFHSPLDQSTLMEKILEDPEVFFKEPAMLYLLFLCYPVR